MTAVPVLPPELRPDCAACCGLCCVALPFDAVQGFGFDKPAHTPCSHLRPDFRCAIHPELEDRGFHGCKVFDCHGAGQWVTQHLFDGGSWSTSPEIGEAMFEAFSRLRPLHELRALLVLALQRVQEPQLHSRLQSRLQELEALCRNGALHATRAELGTLQQATKSLLRELAATPAAIAWRSSKEKPA